MFSYEKDRKRTVSIVWGKHLMINLPSARNSDQKKVVRCFLWLHCFYKAPSLAQVLCAALRVADLGQVITTNLNFPLILQK